ncbi:MAG: PIN domain-containing protein [Conexivisphaerales archaeon]
MRFQKSRRLIEGLRAIYLPVIALYELVWVLWKLGLEAGKIAEVVEAIMKNPKVVIYPDDGEFSLNAFRRVISERARISDFNDKAILMTALKLKKAIATHDTALPKQARALGIDTLL